MNFKPIFLNLLLLLPAALYANVGTYGFKPFPNRYFVETGTFGGDGVQKALNAGCFNGGIFSIEANSNCVNDCKRRFMHNKNVHLFHGDSKTGLWDMIKDLDGTITFWLDAHIFPPVTDRQNAPLIEELEQIKRHHIKTHTILIDDLSCCGSLAFDFITLDDLKNKVLEINPNYTIELLDGGDADEAKNNILLAYIK